MWRLGSGPPITGNWWPTIILWEKGKGDTYSFLQFNPQQNDSFQATACPARLGVLCDPSNLNDTLSARGGEFGLMGSTVAAAR